MNPTKEQLAKLPKWAQEHIKAVTHQRDTVACKLDRLCDSQTRSNIWTEDFKCRQYIQGHTVEFDFQGVSLNVNLSTGRGLELAWKPSGDVIGALCFIPTSYQRAQIKNLAYDQAEFNRLVGIRKKHETKGN